MRSAARPNGGTELFTSGLWLPEPAFLLGVVLCAAVMAERARVLVHGATGFTGRLVCAALARRAIRFAVSGRSAEKLEALRAALGDVEVCRVDLADPSSLQEAFRGRTLVCACAGPFTEIGEAPLATCARSGIHYVDTSGEQVFVLRSVRRYRATAEASGACVVPAMAFEIALADWAAHLAAERLGGEPDSIDIVYATRAAGEATPGTKRSALGVIGDDASQYIDGALRREAAAAIVRRFRLQSGRRLSAASFPSPEAVMVPLHTGARTVRTFMAMSWGAAFVLHTARGVVPKLVGLSSPLLARAIAHSREGPDQAQRMRSAFEIVAEARRARECSVVRVLGHDPYGVTAEIQAWAAARALAGNIEACGVVAPSVAIPPAEAFAELARFGVTVV